jgi:hypothetical protein
VLRPLLLASDRRPASEAHQEPALRQFVEQPRAQRFAVHTLLRYRTVGDGEWHKGTTVNISESGVLFQTEQGVPANGKIEMRFSLSTGVLGEPAAQVTCRGEIARAISEPGSGMALAARITKFHFGRAGRPPGAPVA